MVVAETAQAAEWYLNNELGQFVSYETNIGLESGGTDQNDVSGLQLSSSLAAQAGVRTPAIDISLTTLFNFTQFPDNSELNSNDQYITLAGRRSGERWTAALTGQYIRDTTRTSDEEDTGTLILANKRREAYAIGSEFGYQLTEVDQVSLSPAYSYNHFDTTEVPDSSTISLALNWTRVLTARSQFLSTATASKLNSNDTERGNDNSRYYTLAVGGRHRFSDNLQATLTAGPTFAETDTVDTVNGERQSNSDFSVGYGFNATLSYDLAERLQVQSTVARALTPSTSTGTLNEDTTVGLSASYQLYPNLFAELPLFYQHREQVGGSSDDDEADEARDYVSVEPTLRWRIGRDWDLRVGYGLRWQSSDEGTGVSNAVFAFLTFRPPQVAMSR